MKIRDLGATTGPRPHAIKLTEYGTACSDPSPIAQRNANKYGMPAIGGGQPETTTGILKNSPTSVMASPAAHRPHSAGQRGDGDAPHTAKFGIAAELAPIGGGGPVSPMTGRSALGGGAALRASGFGMSARDGFGGKDPNFSPSPPPSQWLIMAREARDQAVPLRETSPSWAMQDSNVAKLGYDMGEVSACVLAYVRRPMAPRGMRHRRRFSTTASGSPRPPLHTTRTPNSPALLGRVW